MSIRLLSFVLALALAACASTPHAVPGTLTYPPDIAAAIAAPIPAHCPVTRVNDGAGGVFRNEALEVVLPAQSKFIFAPRSIGFAAVSDGALGMKVGWERYRAGPLSISGRRLDGEAAPLRARIPSGYGDIGFQSTYVIFPTPGCWEVTGNVAAVDLRFVVWVIKVGDGPTSRLDL